MKDKNKILLWSNGTIKEDKKHKEYCNKLKLQKKGAKQYRAMDLAKNLGLWSKKAEKYKRKKNYFRNGKKNTVEIRVKMWIHALKHLKRK